MKNSLVIFLLAMSAMVSAQPAIKVYAYSQVITPGMIRQRDIPAENGGRTAGAPLNYTHYYIYAALNPGIQVQFKQVWIRGQWYKIGGMVVENTPVRLEAPSPRELVPAAKLKVTRVEPGDSITSIKRPSSTLAALMKKSELILQYSWKGRIYYKAVNKITELEKLHAE